MAVPTSAPTAAADAFAAVSFEPSDILKEYGETPRFPLGDAASLLQAQLELAGREQGVVLQRSSDELVDAFVEGASLTVATPLPAVSSWRTRSKRLMSPWRRSPICVCPTRFGRAQGLRDGFLTTWQRGQGEVVRPQGRKHDARRGNQWSDAHSARSRTTASIRPKSGRKDTWRKFGLSSAR